MRLNAGSGTVGLSITQKYKLISCFPHRLPLSCIPISQKFIYYEYIFQFSLWFISVSCQLGTILTHQAQRSQVVISFEGGVRPSVRTQDQVHTCLQNKLMTGPGGSLKSLDLLFIFLQKNVHKNILIMCLLVYQSIENDHRRTNVTIQIPFKIQIFKLVILSNEHVIQFLQLCTCASFMSYLFRFQNFELRNYTEPLQLLYSSFCCCYTPPVVHDGDFG